MPPPIALLLLDPARRCQESKQKTQEELAAKYLQPLERKPVVRSVPRGKAGGKKKAAAGELEGAK